MRSVCSLGSVNIYMLRPQPTQVSTLLISLEPCQGSAIPHFLWPASFGAQGWPTTRVAWIGQLAPTAGTCSWHNKSSSRSPRASSGTPIGYATKKLNTLANVFLVLPSDMESSKT